MRKLWMVALLLAGSVQAGGIDRLGAVLGQMVEDGAFDPPTPVRVPLAQLVWQQTGKGPTGMDGVICTYETRDGLQFQRFNPSYCPLEVQVRP
jgi:hypothetical protein